MNRAGLSYNLAVNHLADMTSEERRVLRGRRSSTGYNGGLPFHMKEGDLQDAPDTIDWRIYGGWLMGTGQ